MPKAKSDLKIPESVTFLDGRGEMPMVEVKTPWSTAEIYLHGANVTHFQKNDEPALLFLSQCSRFAPEQPIRGGIPIIFPWFGMGEGRKAQHGFARNKDWQLEEITPHKNGSVSLRFRLPDCAEAAEFPKFRVDYIVSVDETLGLELVVTNQSATNFEFENCLHTYFSVGDLSAVSIVGLHDTSYLDKTDDFRRKNDTAQAVRIDSETDRTYLNTTSTVEIHDAQIRRTIRVEKEGSASTVVWNPWIARAQQLSDFGDEEYRKMVCVESGNIGPDKIILPPMKTSALKVRLATKQLK